jgi:hypothetical protein
MSKNSQYEISTIFKQLDDTPKGLPKFVQLKNTAVKVGAHNQTTLHRLYIMSKTQELKCSCCGIVPKYIVYKNQALQIIVENNNFLTLDHIIPKSEGGSDCVENMQIMCRFCNGRKGSKIEEDVKFGYHLENIFHALICKNLKKVDIVEALENLKVRVIERIGKTIVEKEIFIKKVWVHVQALLGKYAKLEKIKMVPV